MGGISEGSEEGEREPGEKVAPERPGIYIERQTNPYASPPMPKTEPCKSASLRSQLEISSDVLEVEERLRSGSDENGM